MKIGFLGSTHRIDLIKKVVERYFPSVTSYYIVSQSAEFQDEIQQKLIELKDQIDCFIFGGEVEHQFYRNIFDHKVVVDYMKKDWSWLQSALLKATFKSIDISNVSIDSFSSSIVNTIMDELVDNNMKLDQHILKRYVFGSDYINKTYKTHKDLYLSQQISGCITALSPIYTLLQNEGIPVVYACPTTDIVQKTIRKVIDTHDTRKMSPENFAMIIIKLIPQKDYSFIRRDEYLFMHEKMKVAEEVYYFAKNANAAVVNDRTDEFVILMNKNDLTEYTNNMQQFYLLNSINTNTNFDINIGIGYGFNPSEAKFNANLAIEKSGGNINQIYLVTRENSIIGPFDFLATSQSEVKLEDKFFNDLCKKSGLSQSTLYKLYILTEKKKKKNLTAHELAQALNISLRSSNRIIHKLLDANYAQSVGSSITGNAGRPRDLYNINLKLDI